MPNFHPRSPNVGRKNPCDSEDFCMGTQGYSHAKRKSQKNGFTKTHSSNSKCNPKTQVFSGLGAEGGSPSAGTKIEPKPWGSRSIVYHLSHTSTGIHPPQLSALVRKHVDHLPQKPAHNTKLSVGGGGGGGHLCRTDKIECSQIPSNPHRIPTNRRRLLPHLLSAKGTVPPPPRVQEPAMFDRGTKGRFLRTLFPLNSTAEPGVGSCARPWATPYRGKKNFRRVAPGHACPLLSHS